MAVSSTPISWTDSTWSPTRGCSRVSAGCDQCYAMKQAHRFSRPGGAYEGLTRLGKHGVDWTGVVRLVPSMLDQPMRWRKPRRIFVDSMSDLFHPALKNEEIAAVFGVMAAAPQHVFQILTKRPERALEFFRWLSGRPRAHLHGEPLACTGFLLDVSRAHPEVAGLRVIPAPPVVLSGEGAGALNWPLPNVHLGVSVEDQATADERIPILLRCPAALRWISLEPQLADVDLSRYISDNPRCKECGTWDGRTKILSTDGQAVIGHSCQRHFVRAAPGGIDWVVQGGESGPGARPFDLAWARRTRDQCRAAAVPYFCKQLGSRPVQRWCSDCGGTEPAHVDREQRVVLKDRGGKDPAEWPEDIRLQLFPGDPWPT